MTTCTVPDELDLLPLQKKQDGNKPFLTYAIFFSDLNYNCSNLLDMRNLQEQVKKRFVTIIVLAVHCLNELF